MAEMLLAEIRKGADLTQEDLAKTIGIRQASFSKLGSQGDMQINRLESPSYEGHSLSMLRRVARVLGATVEVELKTGRTPKSLSMAEPRTRYDKIK